MSRKSLSAVRKGTTTGHIIFFAQICILDMRIIRIKVKVLT